MLLPVFLHRKLSAAKIDSCFFFGTCSETSSALLFIYFLLPFFKNFNIRVFVKLFVGGALR